MAPVARCSSLVFLIPTNLFSHNFRMANTHTHTHRQLYCQLRLPINFSPSYPYFPSNCSAKLKSLFSFYSHTLTNLACFWHLCFIYFWWASRSAWGVFEKKCQEMFSSYTNQFSKSHAIYARNIWKLSELRLRTSLSLSLSLFYNVLASLCILCINI